MNFQQRLVELSFPRVGASRLRAVAPPDRFAAPPGGNLLDVLNTEPTPGVGHMVRLCGARTLAFGFRCCPSVCPSTLAESRASRRALGALGRRVRLAFATLDPERDTVEAMRAWLQQFYSALIGLRDNPMAIARCTRALRSDWQRVPGRDAVSHTIDHGVQSRCVDPWGRLRLLLRPGASPLEVASDFRQLLAGN